MSTTIENQVVSMQFDNKHFESNVKTSLSTLDKLKNSLKLTDAAKGFENIDRAAKKVDMSTLGGAVDKVGLKFNGLYTIADQALRNITTRVQHCAENIVKSFTIDPVKTGFQEYETQINAVQTILANTQSKGTTLGDVSSALDELNKYADKTIYNFTEMTRNIGTFTAAGVDLDTSVNAIQGIANLAAVSGSNAQQASTAMYQLSQALASGTVKLMDWNSVVNAGMGGQVFQDALKETARVHGVAIDDMIEKEGSFRETLKDGWLTADILTETLWKFTLAGEDMTKAQKEMAEAQLKGLGYTDKQIEGIFNLGQTATDAATKVKTFTQLMDTMKESAQSGWTQTWELLVGDFDDAKSLWTGISEFFTGEKGILTKSADLRNEILGGALNSNWDKLTKKLEETGVKTEDFESKVKDVAKKHGYDVDAIIEKYGSLEVAFQKNALKADLLKEAVNGLGKAGKKVNKDFNLDNVNRTLKAGFKGEDTKDVEKALEALGYSLKGNDGKYYGGDGLYGLVTERAIRQFQKDHGLMVDGILGPKTLELLKKEAAALENVSEEAGKADESVMGLIDNISDMGGRELLIEGFENVFSGIGRLLAPIGESFRSAFGLDDPAALSAKLYKALEGFRDATAGFREWTKSEDGKAVIDGLTSAFKGLWSIVKLVGSAIGGFVKGAFTIFGKLLSTVGVDIVKVAGHIGDAITKFQEWITSSETLSNIFEVVSNAITGLIDTVRNWIKAFFELPSVQKALENFGVEFEKIGKTFKDRFGNSDIGKRFQEFIDRVKAMDGISLDNIKMAFSDFFNNVLGPLWKNEDGSTIFDGLIDAVKKIWDAAGKYFKGVGEKLGAFGGAIATFFSTIKEWLGKNAGGLFALASLVSIFFILKKISDAIKVIAEPFGQFGELAENLGEGVKRLSKAASFKLKAEGVKAIATAIAILAGSLVALTLVDTTKLWSAVGALAVTMVALGGLIVVLNKFGGDLKDVTKLAGSILMLSGALMVFAIAAKTVAGVDAVGLGKTGLVLLGFIGLVKLLAVVTKGSTIDIASFGKMMLGLSGALLIMGIAVGILGRMDTATLVKGGAAVGAFLIGMALMMKATRSLEKDTPRFAVTMAGLSASLLIMSVAVGILGRMDVGTLLKGGAAVGAFLIGMALMMKASNVLDKDMPRFGAAMFGLSAGLLAMALAVKVIAGIDNGDLVKGGAVVAAFLGMMVIMMAATKLLTKHSANAGKVGLMILSFAASMVLLTGAIAILAMIDLGDLAKAIGAIAAVGLIFAGMVALTKFAKVGKGVKTTIITMAAAVGVLAISIAALSFVDTSKLLGASAALGIVMGMFALMSFTAKAIGIGGIASVLVLTGIVAILGYIVKELSDIPADGALKVSGALSALILSLSGACLMLAAVGATGPAALIGVGVLAALMAVIGIFAGIAIASLPAIGTQLSEFMNNASDFIDGAKKITPEVGDGLTNLADAIMTLTSAGALNSIMFGSPLGKLTEQLKPLGQGLKDFADTVNDCDIDSANVDAAVTTAKGLAELATVMPNTEGLWGWLSGKQDLGEFGDDLANLGSGLAAFAQSISGEDFTTDNIDSAVTVAEGLADLAAVLPNSEGLWGWLSGKQDLTNFGDDLASLGSGLSAFAQSVSGEDFTTDNIDSAVTVAEGLADLSAVLPNTEGFWGWISGQEDIASFGTKMESFGSSLAMFAQSISGEDFTTDNIDSAVTIAEGLADLSAVLPNTEGFWGWLNGKEDLSGFGTKMESFGSSLASFAQAVSGENFTTDNIDSAVTVAEGLADLAAVLPNTEGLWGWISGKEDLSEFGDDLGALGSGLASFASNLSGKDFTADNIDSAITIAEGLADLSTVLPNTEGLWGWVSGKEDLSEFGNDLGALASGLASFAENLSWEDFNDDNIDSAVGVAESLSALAATVGENSAGWNWITGTDGLDTFGTKIETLGTKLASFCSSVSGQGFSADSVSTAVSEIEKIVGLAERLGGENVGNLNSLGGQIEEMGWSLSEFSRNTASLDAGKFSSIATGLSELASINVDNADAIEDFVGSLGDISTEGVDAFVNSFKNSAPKVLDSVSSMVKAAEEGLKIKGKNLPKIVKEMVAATAEASYSGSAVLKFMSAGYSMAEGFAKGISSGTFMAVAKASAMASLALAAAKSVLKINSPSKVFIPVGEAVPEGFAMGIDNLSGMVKRSTESMADNAIDGTANAIARIADIVNMDIDAQPTIRPVLDLSEVESGVSGINGMFGMQPSVGVMSNIRSINSMMSSRQNGVNSDVVSAIKDLSGKLGKASGDVYNVNGVTYDDGSNITNAVKELVRGVKVERRI